MFSTLSWDCLFPPCCGTNEYPLLYFIKMDREVSLSSFSSFNSLAISCMYTEFWSFHSSLSSVTLPWGNSLLPSKSLWLCFFSCVCDPLSWITVTCMRTDMDVVLCWNTGNLPRAAPYLLLCSVALIHIPASRCCWRLIFNSSSLPISCYFYSPLSALPCQM